MARPRGERSNSSVRPKRRPGRGAATSRRNLWIGIGVAVALIGGLVAFVLTGPTRSRVPT